MLSSLYSIYSYTKTMQSPNTETNFSLHFADFIAQQCYAKYAEIPKTGKPNDKQWTLLAGIVKVEDWSATCNHVSKCQVVALGTGSKCIGRSKLSPNGDILNDSHAEVMARRGFLRYLYVQARMLYETGKSNIFHIDSKGKCVLEEEVSFHFFTSHTPCGDASIFPKAAVYLEDNGHCLNLSTTIKTFVSATESHEIDNQTLCKLSDSLDGNSKCEIFESKNVNNVHCNDKVVEDFLASKRKNCDSELNTECKKQCRNILNENKELPRNVENNGMMLPRKVNVGLSCPHHDSCVGDSNSITNDSKGFVFTQNVDSETANCLSEIVTNSRRNCCNAPGQNDTNAEYVKQSSSINPSEDLYRTGAKCLASESLQDSHEPGVDYHTVGALRTKPGRGDRTLSLSCSDKLARWNAVGIQGALLSLLLAAPVRFSSVIVGGGCPFSRSALYRAVVGRVAMQSSALVDPLFLQSEQAFPDARPKDGSRQPCPSSIVWCCVPDNPLEVAVAGKKQGVTKKVAHSPAGRLSICKKELLKQFVQVFSFLLKRGLPMPPALQNQNINLSYQEWKSLAIEYHKTWEAVRLASFPAWSPKPDMLLGFTVLDENEQRQLND